MGDPFRKVQPGESVSFSAGVHNAMVDAARLTKSRQLDQGSDDRTTTRDAAIIKVRNDTGADLNRRSVLGLNGPLFDPGDINQFEAFLRDVAFSGVVPGVAHNGRFGVLLEPAPAGAIARAYVAGVTQVVVDVVDTTHTCCDVAVGATSALASSRDGSAQILWRQGEAAGGATGEQWAIIRFGTPCGPGADEGAYGEAARCDCPEETYEVAVACGDCAGGDKRFMPKYWILTVVTSQTTAYGDDCAALACIEIVPGDTVELQYQSGAYGYAYDCAYGDDGCCWKGQGGLCLQAELYFDSADDLWHLRLTDKAGCLLYHGTISRALFDCCGLNTNWQASVSDPGKCTMSLRLEPHPCTCCPADQVEDSCGCRRDPSEPDTGKASKMEFILTGILEDPLGMTPCNCTVGNNVGGSYYSLTHAAPNACAWHGGKTNLSAGEVTASASITYNALDQYFYLDILSGCLNITYRVHADDFDCCEGGTFLKYSEDKRTNPAALCYQIPDSINVTGVKPCCD